MLDVSIPPLYVLRTLAVKGQCAGLRAPRAAAALVLVALEAARAPPLAKEGRRAAAATKQQQQGQHQHDRRRRPFWAVLPASITKMDLQPLCRARTFQCPCMMTVPDTACCTRTLLLHRKQRVPWLASLHPPPAHGGGTLFSPCAAHLP
jgi:hypothetical protein